MNVTLVSVKIQACFKYDEVELQFGCFLKNTGISKVIKKNRLNTTFVVTGYIFKPRRHQQ